MDQDREKLRQLEEMEETFLKEQAYTCMEECGEMQAEYLKAQDFSDQITDRLRLYNVCRAKMSNGCTCGLAFPAKMWTQTPGTWKFFCKVDWASLVDAALTMDDDSHIRKYAVMMVERHGEDFNKWPAIRCWAKFFPWRRGASIVAELQMDDGTWEAFMADRLPTELDDEIKKCRADFVKASKMMDPAEVQALMPKSFPMRFARGAVHGDCAVPH